MNTLKDLAHRLAIKVVTNVIALAYNPNQAEIFQLLWDMYEIFSFVIQ